MRTIPMPCGFRRDGVQCSKEAGHKDDHVLDEEYVLTANGLEPTGRPFNIATQSFEVAGIRVVRAEKQRPCFDPPSGAFPVSTAEDIREQKDRAIAVMLILDRCHEELVRLELIPCNDAGDVNALSAAKGYVDRAHAILGGRFS